jgi:tetratricopeptide (TPR) repeat protein
LDAVKAYKCAEKWMKRKHPDLYHNRGTIYEYLEEYELAIKDFIMADKIDPTLEATKRVAGI